MGANRPSGVLAPVVTPFKPDLSPDPERLIRHCQWLLSQNCGLAVFGTNSEANSMSAEERMTLLDALIAAGIDPAHMMPGTGCCSISETVELTAHAVNHGCAGVLMLPPFYYKNVGDEGLHVHFSEVIQRVGDTRLRIYLYHIPPVAVVGITPKLVERLLQAYPTAIAGMKDSSGDWNNTKTFLDAFAVRAGRAVRARHGESATRPGEHARHGMETDGSFDVFVGSESFLLANIRNGGAGTISATANVNPAAIYSLFAKARDEAGSSERGAESQQSGNWKQTKRPTPNAERPTLNEENSPPTREARPDLEAQQAELNVVREVFARNSWPSMIAALKQAIAIYRNDPEWSRVRPPLVELTTEQSRKLAVELGKIGFSSKLLES